MAAMLPTVLLVVISLMLISSSEAAGGRGRSGRFSIIKKGEEDVGATILYWGQGGRAYDGSLRKACESLEEGDIVIVSGLTKFGFGREPRLNLSDHCDPYGPKGCSFLSRQIWACQRSRRSVFLSIGGDYDGEDAVYDMYDEEVAEQMADYLRQTFLGGYSRSRPLGNAVFNGIDFDIEGGGPDGKWASLARRLSEYTVFFKPVQLSAAVECSIPNPYLDSAITDGLFDIVSVKFFDDESCQYENGNADKLLKTFEAWSSHPGVRKLFVGLPTRPEVPGHLSDAEFDDLVLAHLRDSPKYGGIMLWSRYQDINTSSSGASDTNISA